MYGLWGISQEEPVVTVGYTCTVVVFSLLFFSAPTGTNKLAFGRRQDENRFSHTAMIFIIIDGCPAALKGYRTVRTGDGHQPATPPIAASYVVTVSVPRPTL